LSDFNPKPNTDFNMKRILLTCSLAVATVTGAIAQWQPAGDRIRTEWAEKVDPAHPLPEYPRPELVREAWSNLNGLWEYAIRPVGAAEPAAFDGEILVPFAIESALSGVGKTVTDREELWYRRTFDIPAAWKNRRVLLHFGAVDWRADVWINDVLIGSHEGGYTPFSFDITPFLTGLRQQKLTVRVWDSTDKGMQPRGKQVSKPNGIWYTAVTGIWQTVWIEPVAEASIAAVVPTADLDRSVLNVDARTESTRFGDIVSATLSEGGKPIASAKGAPGNTLRLSVPEPRLWSPESPFLYDLEVTLTRDGKVIDRVASYAAMRKIGTARDAHGILRMTLNDKPLFQYGPLDQGWWPDGLYTAPTDEALLFDIVKTKELGFNMIRKHIKVEPARWYYHCDREGILVWQDMPSGDHAYGTWRPDQYNAGSDAARTEVSKANFRREWREIMDLCRPHPCVVVWVPFNESWGQFDTERIVAETAQYDPSRLVDPASGGNHRPCGDLLDLHHYPHPRMFLFDAERVNVLGEYGGIGLPLEGHLWAKDKNWGYIQFKDTDAVTDEYVKYARQLEALVERGFSAAVYTQTTDVEGEVNGLMTYDRKVMKVRPDKIREANRRVIEALGTAE